MESLPPVLAVLLSDTKQFKAGMAEAKAEMDSVAGHGTSAFNGLASVGKAALLGLATAAIGVGLVSVKLATDFQASMERIATQAQVPQSQIAGLSNKVLNLSGQVGISAKTLADGLYHVESTFQSTGITGAKAMDLLKVAAEGAQIGNSNLVDTVNALDAAIVAGIPGANDYKQVMGALNATVGAGDMTMQDLADAIGTGVIPVVKNYGLTLNDIGAALATFGDNSIRGAKAGTALRMAVQAIAVPVKGGAKALSDMGMSMSQMASDMAKGGLRPALEDLQKHMQAIGLTGIAMLKDGTFTSVGEKLTEIFGKRAGTGVALLYDQLGRLESKFPDITHAANTFDAAWKATAATGKIQWEQLSQAAQALAIRLGEWLIPKLIELKDWLASVVGWFERHKTVALELAAAIAGPLMVAIGVFLAAQFAAAIAFLASPIGLVMAALALLSAGVVYAYTHWQWFRDTVQAVWDWMQRYLWPSLQSFASFVGTVFNDPLAAAAALFHSTFAGVGDLLHGVTSAWNNTVGQLPGLHIATSVSVAATAQDVGRAAAHATQAAPLFGPPSPPPGWTAQDLGRSGAHSAAAAPMYGPPAQSSGFGANSVGPRVPAPQPGAVAQAWQSVYSAMAPIVSQISDFVNKKAGEVSQWWDSHSQEIGRVTKVVWQGVELDVRTAITNTKIVIATVGGIFDGIVKTIEAFGKGAWKHTWKGLTDIVQGTWNTIQGIVSLALDQVLGGIGIVLDLITGHWGKAWDDLKKMVKKSGQDVIDTLNGMYQATFQAGVQLIQGLIDGVGSMVIAAAKAVWDLGDKVLQSILKYFGISSPSTVMAARVGAPLIQGILTGAQSAIGSLVGWFASLPTTVINALGNIAGGFVSIGVQIVQGMISGVASMAGNLGQSVLGAVIGAANQGRGAVQGLGPSLGAAAAGGGNSLIHMASGGRVTGPVLAMLGEGGEPETVVPDSVWRQWSNRGNVQPLSAGGGGGTGTGTGLTINLTVQGNVATQEDLVRAIHTGLLRINRTHPLGFT